MARIARPLALAALLSVCVGSLATAAPGPDWDALADVETVEVLTHDEDGDLRTTKIWLVVLDGQGFIRTGSSAWGENVERDPDLVLRIEDTEYPLTADFIEDEALRERVTDAFREKYGFSDAMISLFRGRNPRIMHMLPR